MSKIKERSFGGKLKDFSSKAEKRKEQKHLKAYLRGYKTYVNGYERVGDVKVPKIERVLEVWK